MSELAAAGRHARDVLRAHLDEGDLTCVLSDRGVALALAGDWPVRFGERAFVGPARTVDTVRGGLAPIVATLDALQEGDVLLIVASDAEEAVLGGRLAARACRARAAGALIDGRVRDVPTLRNQPLPIVARGVAPMRSEASDAGARDVPVDVGGTTVRPGDLMLCDENGVVVVRPEAFAAIVTELDAWLAEERAADRAAGIGGSP